MTVFDCPEVTQWDWQDVILVLFQTSDSPQTWEVITGGFLPKRFLLWVFTGNHQVPRFFFPLAVLIFATFLGFVFTHTSFHICHLGNFISHSHSQFSPVQYLDGLGCWGGGGGGERDDSAEILFQSFLQKALVSSSGMGMDIPAHAFSQSYWHFVLSYD